MSEHFRRLLDKTIQSNCLWRIRVLFRGTYSIDSPLTMFALMHSYLSWIQDEFCRILIAKSAIGYICSVDLQLFRQYSDEYIVQPGLYGTLLEASMTTFDKREEAFEAKFAHDEELKFKATARRNKLLGLWASQKLGFSGERAEEYAKEVVRSDFEEPGDEDVYRKITQDFSNAGLSVAETDIRSEMSSLMHVAVDQIHKGE